MHQAELTEGQPYAFRTNVGASDPERVTLERIEGRGWIIVRFENGRARRTKTRYLLAEWDEKLGSEAEEKQAPAPR